MDEFNIEKLEGIVNDYQQKIPQILEEELVYIIDEEVDAKANAHPYVNMAKGQLGEEQMLVIAGERFPVKTGQYTFEGQLGVGMNFGNQFRLANRLTTFTDNNNRHRFWSPTFERQMVVTTYAGHERAGKYALMFSQIDTTPPLSRPSGPQAELIKYGGQLRLFVIDAATAQRLYWQCTNWFYDWSLTYQLVRAAHGVLIMTTALNRFYYLNDVQQQYIDELRDRIYIYGELVSQRLEKAMYVERIYKVAIVRQYSMPVITAHLVQQQPLVLDPPNYNIYQPEPFNGANIDLNRAIHDWQVLYGLISNHPLYQTPWHNVFNELANRNTSIAFMDIQANDGEITRPVRLSDNHNFNIRIQFIDDNTYQLRSQAFPPTKYYRLCRYLNQPQWLAYKSSQGGGGIGNHKFYVPLHSHGLSGSNQDLDDFGRDFNGNNGYQAMSLLFRYELPANGGTETTHRLYFVNREMAKELRFYFETRQVMVEYQTWFGQLLPISRHLSDAHRMAIQSNRDPEVLRAFNNRLGLLNRQLFHRYEWLVKLEQIWKYSVLVPNPQLQEPAIKSVRIHAAIYSLGNSKYVKEHEAAVGQ